MRDIEAAYKEALVEEYEGYVRAGRTEDAEHVAGILKDRYGYDAGKRNAEEAAPVVSEKAAEEKPPEAAVDPKPRRAPRGKPAQGEEK